ncbi:MAG: exodeoxyribonuclease subunit alpha [Pseudomonadota bacterium]|jgi:exodeoxyribonuclease V alpha subunit
MNATATSLAPHSDQVHGLGHFHDSHDSHGQPAADALLTPMSTWVARGWLRRLDVALARFVAELDPAAEAVVVLATALLAQLEGRGHTCLPLDELLAEPGTLLVWPAEGQAALQDMLATLPPGVAAWQSALARCRAVDVAASLHGLPVGDHEPATAATPLVLAGQRLYLRRYWGYEQRVARQVRERSKALLAVDEAAARQWLDRLFPAPTQTAATHHTPSGAEVSAATPSGAEATAPDTPTFDWQKAACAIALRGRLSVITGGPGTGKTYTAARLLALLFATSPAPERLRVALAAPTGKAAARLKQSIDTALQGLQASVGPALDLAGLTERMGAARTLHALLGARPDTRKLRHHAGQPLEVDVLIVDEASMVHLEMMANLLDALPAIARVVLLGDKDQLASVEAGAVLGDLCRQADAGAYRGETLRYLQAVAGQSVPARFADEHGPALAQQTVMLRRSQRFGGAIGALALAVNAGAERQAQAVLTTGHAAADADPDAVRWLAQAEPQDIVQLACAGRAGAPGGYRSYLQAITSRPARAEPGSEPFDDWVRAVLQAFDRFRVLCAVREGEWGVAGLNRSIQARLAELELLKPRGEWYEGRPVLVRRNDYGTGVFNGDIGIALKPLAREAGLRVYFVDGTAVRSVSVSRLPDVETAFALTVHKSQGSEFEHSVLVLPPQGGRIATRELIYTGITRARKAFTLVTPQAEVFTQGLAQRTQRSSGLPELFEAEMGAS